MLLEELKMDKILAFDMIYGMNKGTNGENMSYCRANGLYMRLRLNCYEKKQCKNKYASAHLRSLSRFMIGVGVRKELHSSFREGLLVQAEAMEMSFPHMPYRCSIINSI